MNFPNIVGALACLVMMVVSIIVPEARSAGAIGWALAALAFLERIKFTKEPELEIGATYRLKNGDPFTPVEAKVIEVKDGWVCYHYAESRDFRHSMRLTEFQNMYGH